MTVVRSSLSLDNITCAEGDHWSLIRITIAVRAMAVLAALEAKRARRAGTRATLAHTHTAVAIAEPVAVAVPAVLNWCVGHCGHRHWRKLATEWRGRLAVVDEAVAKAVAAMFHGTFARDVAWPAAEVTDFATSTETSCYVHIGTIAIQLFKMCNVICKCTVKCGHYMYMYYGLRTL